MGTDKTGSNVPSLSVTSVQSVVLQEHFPETVHSKPTISYQMAFLKSMEIRDSIDRFP
jgi:hypothetical protein